MGRFFNLDSPLMTFLSKMADLMILNLLTLICCIPIITAGDAMTALYYMTVKMVKNEECYLVKGYFKSFKENFKQATIIWLIALLVGIIMIVVFAVHKHNQKKRQNNFEDELEEKMKAIKEGTAGEEPVQA